MEDLASAGNHVEDLLTVSVEFCRSDTVDLRQILDPLWTEWGQFLQGSIG